jgi:transcription initiation factor TFIIIB Brf1 subunit/transcription initiation factor TFIIB
MGSELDCKKARAEAAEVAEVTEEALREVFDMGMILSGKLLTVNS